MFLINVCSISPEYMVVPLFGKSWSQLYGQENMFCALYVERCRLACLMIVQVTFIEL